MDRVLVVQPYAGLGQRRMHSSHAPAEARA
jgi:hypothetical protein